MPEHLDWTFYVTIGAVALFPALVGLLVFVLRRVIIRRNPEIDEG